MGGILDAITGAGAERQKRQMQSAQRTTLAQLAAQQAEADQAGSTGGARRRGRGLLTFAQASLGGAGQAMLG